jgi:hypothetical protein
MKNLLFFKNGNSLLKTPVMRFLQIALFFLFIAQFSMVHGQAKLSIQGILKKANGEAVEDDTYSLTFRLYNSLNATVPQAIWMETQPSVDVVSGIYSTVLGTVTPLTVPFNVDYYLGVAVNAGTEMTPRITLTSAPYALSLRGQSNQFPSSGIVIADSVRVNGGVLARGGAPGLNGASKNGYAFTTNMGDKDSGLFSTALGQVSLYVNNVPMLTASPDSVAIRSDLRLKKDANINYNGLDDWRLVYNDNFQAGNNSLGWNVYNANNGEYNGWNKGSSDGAAPLSGDATKFQGRYLYPNENFQVLKKSFDLSGVGTYSYIKVKFKYYYIDSWNGSGFDEGNNDIGWAAFAETAGATQFRMGWWEPNYAMDGYTAAFNTSNFITANKWEGNLTNTEYFKNAEMTAYKNSNSNTIWVMFGSTLNNPHADESYGVGMIEVWVK